MERPDKPAWVKAGEEVFIIHPRELSGNHRKEKATITKLTRYRIFIKDENDCDRSFSREYTNEREGHLAYTCERAGQFWHSGIWLCSKSHPYVENAVNWADVRKQ